MLRLDHFVLHVDQDMAPLERLQRQIRPMGFPFTPGGGKGTKGFQVTNIWVGLQYIEMVWLKRKESDWRKEWVAEYNRGQRGIIGLMLLTDQLDAIRQGLAERGLQPTEPERISISFLWGLLKKVFPWRSVYVGPIPGTDLQISFAELDSPKVLDQFTRYMVPNARDEGILGIRTAIVRQAFSREGWDFLRRLFPLAREDGARLHLPMDEGTQLIFEQNQEPGLTVELHAVTNRTELVGNRFQVENVTVVTTLG